MIKRTPNVHLKPSSPPVTGADSDEHEHVHTQHKCSKSGNTWVGTMVETNVQNCKSRRSNFLGKKVMGTLAVCFRTVSWLPFAVTLKFIILTIISRFDNER